jgi:hypothetical protein
MPNADNQRLQAYTFIHICMCVYIYLNVALYRYAILATLLR